MVICAFCDYSGTNAGQMLSGVEFVWPAIMIASCAFQAGASIIKVTNNNLWSYFKCAVYKENK